MQIPNEQKKMKTLFITTGILLFAYICDAQERAELRILSSDPNSVTIEYRPRIKKNSFTADGAQYQVYVFPEAQQRQVQDAGKPDLRFRDIIVGLPSREGNRVDVIQTEYEDEQNIRIAPVPDWKKGESAGEYIPVYREEPSRNANQRVPEQIAEVVHPGVARDRILANLRVTPVQWNPVSHAARKYSRIIMRVTFGARDPLLTTTVRTKDVLSIPDIINDDQSRSWRVQAKPTLRKASSPSLVTGEWYRMEVNEEGLYKLSRSWFEQAGINVSNLDPRTIKMFSSGGRELPVSITDPRPDNLQEIAIDVIGGDDGKFDANDYVLFYGKGLSGFYYDTRSKTYRHYIHRFDVTNAYLLTYGGVQGKRAQQRASLNDPNPIKPQWFTGKAFVEDEKVNFIRSGRNWVGQKISAGTTGINSATYSMKLDKLISSQPVKIRTQLYSRAQYGTTNNFVIEDNGATLCTINMGTVDLTTDRGDIAYQAPVAECTRDGNIPDQRSVLRFTYSSSDPSQNEGGYVDWIEWYYAHTFNPSNDVLFFSSPETSGAIEYRLDGFTTSDVQVYDVTDDANVVRITNPYISGGTVVFQAAATEGKPNQFVAAASPALKTPGAGKKVANSNLLTNSGAEFIIITAPNLVTEATRLKAYREKEGENKISTLVATTQEIYNEFNSGVTDPVAIRNFIQHALMNWTTKPAYVLLFGDGHYDYLQRSTKERIVVPVFETENSLNLIESYVTDDFFVQVAGNDNRVDLGIGRIPIQNAQEASQSIDKIISYETNQAFEPWRNLVTFVADDGLTTQGDDGNIHTSQAEQLAQSIPPEMNQKKIYIIAYKTEYTSQGRRKPEANRAIIDQVNEGTLIVNYTGHGNENVWAHERVLAADVSIPQMKNVNRLSFLVAATCAFGLYDVPDIRSGAEMMVTKPDGAMIGALSSPRVVYSGENSVFNLQYFNRLLNNGREVDGRAKRLGDAAYSTKQALYGSAGFEKFHLFGDPTVRLLLPRHKSVIDQILVNDKLITKDTVQMKALSKVTFKASVRQPDNTVWTNFNGTTQVSLYDADRYVPVAEWGNWQYELPGGLLYRGQSTIANGRYTVSFVVPKDISYENNTGRISLYIENQQTDGVGYSTQLQITGSDSLPGSPKGPLIDLYLDSRRFKPGDVVSENATLLLDLYDDYGINTTGNGIGHDIEAWLDGSKNSIVLNEYYKSKIDSYREGTVEYLLRNLSTGKHTLKVRAWNIYNISSTAETYFEVVPSTTLSLQNVSNYPNPMSRETAFTFKHNLLEPVDVTIKVYTVSGRLVKQIERRNIPDRFVLIQWDGRDEDGDVLANGVYFYKVIVNTISGSKGSEVIEKLAVLK